MRLRCIRQFVAVSAFVAIVCNGAYAQVIVHDSALNDSSFNSFVIPDHGSLGSAGYSFATNYGGDPSNTIDVASGSVSANTPSGDGLYPHGILLSFPIGVPEPCEPFVLVVGILGIVGLVLRSRRRNCLTFY